MVYSHEIGKYFWFWGTFLEEISSGKSLNKYDCSLLNSGYSLLLKRKCVYCVKEYPYFYPSNITKKGLTRTEYEDTVRLA